MPNHVNRRLVPIFALVVIAAIHLFYATMVVAESSTNSIAEHSDVLLQTIVGLLALLTTLSLALIGWLVMNQKEIFIRLGHAETKIEVRKELCDDRHGD